MIRQSLMAYGEPLQETREFTFEPKGTEVLLQISHCGVCHSDLHLQDGYFSLGEGRRLDIGEGRDLPFTLGHEISGQVVAAGPEAGGLDRTRHYAVFPWIGCGTCSRCTSGIEHLCDAGHQIGINRDGGYASHVLVPHPRYLIDVTGITPAIAGCYMCSGLTAFGAIAKAIPYLRGRAIGLVGLGGVGMMGLQIARAIIQGPVIAADISAEKRDSAAANGATLTLDPAAADARRSVMRAHGGCGAVIDFVGSEASLNFAQSLASKGGAVIVVGLMGGNFAMPIPMFPLRELAILGSYVGSLEQARSLIALVRAGRIAPIPVSTRPLKAANSALDDLRAGKVNGRIVLEA